MLTLPTQARLFGTCANGVAMTASYVWLRWFRGRSPWITSLTRKVALYLPFRTALRPWTTPSNTMEAMSALEPGSWNCDRHSGSVNTTTFMTKWSMKKNTQTVRETMVKVSKIHWINIVVMRDNHLILILIIRWSVRIILHHKIQKHFFHINYTTVCSNLCAVWRQISNWLFASKKHKFSTEKGKYISHFTLIYYI